MSSFNTAVAPERREVARFVMEVQKLLHAALADEAKNGMNQQRVAEMLKVDKSLVSRWFSGANRNMTIETLALLAFALNRRINLDAEELSTIDNAHCNYHPTGSSAYPSVTSCGGVGQITALGETSLNSDIVSDLVEHLRNRNLFEPKVHHSGLYKASDKYRRQCASLKNNQTFVFDDLGVVDAK